MPWKSLIPLTLSGVPLGYIEFPWKGVKNVSKGEGISNSTNTVDHRGKGGGARCGALNGMNEIWPGCVSTV